MARDGGGEGHSLDRGLGVVLCYYVRRSVGRRF